jgi:arsenite methyltransferase
VAKAQSDVARCVSDPLRLHPGTTSKVKARLILSFLKGTIIMEDSRDKIHTLVKEKYSGIAMGNADSCAPSCCGGSPSLVNIIDLGKALDYAEKDLSLAPGEANLGLGCGNPISKAELKPGEIVLDLGSGAGFDAFLAAQRVGESGKVIGVDMTREMIEKARMNSEKLKISNVEFRLGEIEKIPVSDSSVDVVISNCVINLSPDKPAVFKEIHRTLRLGGRIIISDILRSGEMPEEIRSNPAAYTG